MTADPVRPLNVRKLMMQLITGMIAGAGASYLAFSFVDARGLDIDDPSRALALGVGLVFAVIGLFTAFGLALPGLGSKLLNVEDEQELRDQRMLLTSGASICVLIGVALLTLAVGGTLLSATSAGVVAILALAAASVIGFASRRLHDEMLAVVSREGSALSIYVATTAAAAWALTAQFRDVPTIEPLGALAGLVGIQLAAMMWVTARRGLMNPR